MGDESIGREVCGLYFPGVKNSYKFALFIKLFSIRIINIIC